MKLEIKNLGYVKSVQLDLDKDLTVLCGPNNTGKTYVAYALYAFVKEVLMLLPSKKLEQMAETLLKDKQLTLNLREVIEDVNNFFALPPTYIFLSAMFAMPVENFSETEITISPSDNENLLKLAQIKELYQRIIIGSLELIITKDKGSELVNFTIIGEYENWQDLGKIYLEKGGPIFLDKSIAYRIGIAIRHLSSPRPFIMPIERIAINVFSKELSLLRNHKFNQILDEATVKGQEINADYIRRRVTRYPAPIRDSLEIAEDLENYQKSFSEYASFAEEIEGELLKGKVIISKEGEVQFQPAKAEEGLNLPIHFSASVVKSLSNLVIYFRHLAQEGDLIIIDEPELNLHPDNQIKMARIIAKILSKGFKVLISTHSDYIIREINNLIMMHSNPEYAKKHNISADCIIDPNRVSAILFHYDKQKCENLEVSETGFDVKTIDAAINDINDRTRELLFPDDEE